MKRIIILILCCLFLSTASAETAPSIPAELFCQADIAATTFFSLDLTDDIVLQHLDTIEGERVWSFSPENQEATYLFHFDERDRLCRVSCIPLNSPSATESAEEALTVHSIRQFLETQMSHVTDDMLPFSNTIDWRVIPAWNGNSIYTFQILNGSGELPFDNCMIHVYIDMSARMITHITFTYLY